MQAVLFCFPSYGRNAKKSHGKSFCLPWEMLQPSCAGQPLNLHLAARLLTAATFSGGAAGLHATREVVAGKHDLEVVSDEGTHISVARHLEFSDFKGTKKVRETSEIVGSGATSDETNGS